jgi:two-component system, chemotaxis family, sensor kinase CheA
VEFAGGKAVLQYRGEVLPLEDEGEVLGPLGARSAEALESQAVVTVLICLRPGTHGIQRTGMVVRQVLDITAGTLLAEDTAGFGSRLAMVRDRVTMVHRDFAEGLSTQDAAALQEVA